MVWFEDIHSRRIRLTSEWQEHIESDHPEMLDQTGKIQGTLANPDLIVRSRTDLDVELFYRSYETTPVTKKHLCVVVKVLADDLFIITAYFTNTIKRGEILWKGR